MKQYFNILTRNSYRIKYRWLLFSVVPLLLLCYFTSFRKTQLLIAEYNSNVRLLHQMSRRLDSSSAYESKVNEINGWKRQYLLDSSVMDAALIAKVSLACGELGINLKEYKPLIKSERGIWTRLITVNGDFKNMLELIYRLEQVEKICRVASVDFQKVKMPGEEGMVLDCTLYIQNFVKN